MRPAAGRARVARTRAPARGGRAPPGRPGARATARRPRGTRWCGRCARARARSATRRPARPGRAPWPARTPRPRRRRPRGGWRRARGRAAPARSGAWRAPARVHRVRRSRSKVRRRRRPSRSQAPASSGARSVSRSAASTASESDAHVLVDARGVPVRGRAGPLRARPVADRAAGGGQVPRLPEGEREQPQHRGVARVGVARVDQPAGGEREVALGQRVLGRGHEALDALGARVRLGEVHELQRARGHRAHADLEVDARPLLDVVAVAGEVDPVDGADAPLGIGQAARIAVDDRVVGHPRRERVVAGAVLVGGPAALLLGVGARRPPRRAACARPRR